uniref:EF-hand domain-containing protein n=1 Tax=Hemiselmis andersenii TaxID=464988 RepID=A0A6T8JY02_HEMAN|mmetsp:Transcript_30708/g.71763  ORF Transcript_30708/g.71763 Transcript_30708/m.71763 type:complete len:169 (+) Transcript_30708:224-730(+)|eukprot:CAMPEP_0114134522 /NCGR_PEP_ID=MMETSP0043_2-20121206/14211_1 /TAXON_ID=464988 /ORGANISM="Hemiselmis andersenii, Strain CCMP644" /LENGTH=168 /DNA_ID=CAMNT_0001228185 /DNA_START=220 /DNA_END=726 /DNA_ORIENTATION=+
MADPEEEALKESLKNHPHLTLEELREFKELFNLVDEDKGGSISPHELGSLMETLGLKPNQEELDAMIREIDEDGNGEIDFDEFVQVMSRKVQPTYTPEEVKAAFKVFEAATAGLPQGHVKTSALERALTTYGTDKLSLEEAQDLLSQVDPENTGVINYVEYVNMMCST